MVFAILVIADSGVEHDQSLFSPCQERYVCQRRRKHMQVYICSDNPH